jgi:hypothetical protein
MPDEAVNKQPVVLRKNDPIVTPQGPSEDDAVAVTPFQVIRRGEDTLDDNDRVTFADFRPTVEPADEIEEPEVEQVPKEGSAPELASSAESTRTSEPTKSAKTAQVQAAEELAADLDDGKPSQSEPSKPSSSTATNPG